MGVRYLTRALAYGFLIWLIPTLIGLLLFTILPDGSLLAASVIGLCFVFAAMYFACMYFREVKYRYFEEGIALGGTWLLVVLLLNLVLVLLSMNRFEALGERTVLTIPLYLSVSAFPAGIGYAMDSLAGRYRRLF